MQTQQSQPVSQPSKVEPGGNQQDHHLSIWTETETNSQLTSSWEQPLNTPISLSKKRKSLNSDKQDTIRNYSQNLSDPKNTAEDIEIDPESNTEEPKYSCLDTTNDFTEEDTLFFLLHNNPKGSQLNCI